MERRKFIKTCCAIASTAIVPSLIANDVKPTESYKYTDMYFDMEFDSWLPLWFKNVKCYELNTTSSGSRLIKSANNPKMVIIPPCLEKSNLVFDFCDLYKCTVKENKEFLDYIKINIYRDIETNKFQILGYAGDSTYDLDYENKKLTKVRSYLSMRDIWNINNEIKEVVQ